MTEEDLDLIVNHPVLTPISAAKAAKVAGKACQISCEGTGFAEAFNDSIFECGVRLSALPILIVRRTLFISVPWSGILRVDADESYPCTL